MTETFGSYLRSLREEAKVSMSDLADRIDISVTYLSDVERNTRAPLKPSRILLTRKALSLARSQEIKLRFLAARRNGKLVIDVDGLTDYALEVLISMTMEPED